MENFSTIEVVIKKSVATIWLNRPQVHNAFDEQMLNELTECYKYLDNLQDVRIVILRGKGKSFCSGADLQWMMDSRNDYQSSQNSSLILANCFNTIYKTTKPTIAIVHGNVLGGANGLVCASDMAIAIESTKFSFTELRIGLVPATILPYVLSRLNQHSAKVLMYTGRKFREKEAKEKGYIDYVISENEADGYIQTIVNDLLLASPNAITECKSLVNNFSNKAIDDFMITASIESITRTRMMEDSREGISAFFEKRLPGWAADYE